MEFITNKLEETMIVLGKSKRMLGGGGLRNEALVGWNCPPVGWVKINVDGTSRRDGKRAGIGCVVRNDNGSWLVGEARNIEKANLNIAELLALFFGLKLAWRKGYRRIILELDSVTAVNLILGNEVSNEGDRVIVDSCKELLSRQREVKVEHVLKEANKVVDWLANWAMSLGFEERELLQPPLEMSTLLEEDAFGI